MFNPLIFILFPMLLPAQPTVQPVPISAMVAHVPNECQLVVTADVSTLLPYVFSSANKLTNHPFIKNDVRLRRKLLQSFMMVNMQRSSLQKRLGVDVVKAIKYMTVGIHVGKGKRLRNPRVIVILGGDFSAAKIGPLMASMMGQKGAPARLKDGFSYVNGGRRNPSFGWYAKGPLFFGKAKDLMAFAKAGSLRGGKPKAGTVADKMLSNFLPGSIMSMGFAPSKEIVRKATRRSAMMRKLFGTMSYVQAALQYGGSSLLLENPDAAARTKYMGLFRAAGLMSKSGDYFTRALVQLASSLLDPNDNTLPRDLRSLAKHKKTLLPLIRKQIGSKALQFKIWPANNQVNMQLLGNPGLGLWVVGAVVGYLTYNLSHKPLLERPYRSSSSRKRAAPRRVHSAHKYKPATPPRKAAPRKAPERVAPVRKAPPRTPAKRVAPRQ